jgi:hypothetical protein
MYSQTGPVILFVLTGICCLVFVIKQVDLCYKITNSP